MDNIKKRFQELAGIITENIKLDKTGNTPKEKKSKLISKKDLTKLIKENFIKENEPGSEDSTNWDAIRDIIIHDEYSEEEMEDGCIEDEVNRETDRQFEEHYGYEYVNENSSLEEADEEDEEEIETEEEEEAENDEMIRRGEFDAEPSGEYSEIQDHLEMALELAKATGDEKLSTQIGNTIIYTNRLAVKA